MGAPRRWTNRHSGTVSLVFQRFALSVCYAASSHVTQVLLVERRRSHAFHCHSEEAEPTKNLGGGGSSSLSPFAADIQHCLLFPLTQQRSGKRNRGGSQRKAEMNSTRCPTLRFWRGPRAPSCLPEATRGRRCPRPPAQILRLRLRMTCGAFRDGGSLRPRRGMTRGGVIPRRRVFPLIVEGKPPALPGRQ